MSNNKVSVIIRKFKGEILALFPYEPATLDPDTCMCYCSQTMHGTASMDLMTKESKAIHSDSKEAQELIQELVNVGYDLEVLRKMPSLSRSFNIRKGKIQPS